MLHEIVLYFINHIKRYLFFSLPVIYNMKTSQMAYTKKNIMNKDINIKRVFSTSVILLILMSDMIFFVYV